MQQTGIGEYQVAVPRPSEGGYRGVVLYTDSDIDWEVGVPFTVNYPDEWQFDYLGLEAGNLERWAAGSGGQITTFEDELSPEAVQGWWRELDPFIVFVVSLLIFWPMEIAVRRWKMPWRRP
jgi:hypothetical protein